jgi:hypothetical protein
MIEQMLAEVRKIGEAWKEEAARRRAMTSVDPGADTLTFCAAELGKKLDELDQANYWLTPEQYGELHRVTDQTVRNWIERGELPDAVAGPKGWKIPRTAQRIRARRAG